MCGICPLPGGNQRNHEGIKVCHALNGLFRLFFVPLGYAFSRPFCGISALHDDSVGCWDSFTGATGTGMKPMNRSVTPDPTFIQRIPGLIYFHLISTTVLACGFTGPSMGRSLAVWVGFPVFPSRYRTGLLSDSTCQAVCDWGGEPFSACLRSPDFRGHASTTGTHYIHLS